jgi:hypothetical protein
MTARSTMACGADRVTTTPSRLFVRTHPAELGRRSIIKLVKAQRLRGIGGMKSAPAFPERVRPTPKPSGIHVIKRFGYTYQMIFGPRKWTHTQWFETFARRDQALANHNRKYPASDWYTVAEKCER